MKNLYVCIHTFGTFLYVPFPFGSKILLQQRPLLLPPTLTQRVPK